VETIRQGTAEFRFPHPDAFREWVRQHKRREMAGELLAQREAIARFVAGALRGLGCRPFVAKSVEKLAPPTGDELRILRREIDPSGIIIRGEKMRAVR
jgi:hypothetical protein